MTFKIFICYSQKDFFKPGIEIRDYLSDLFPDSSVYIDQIKTKGQKWRPKNEDELKKSSLVVAIITPAALDSKEIERELQISIEMKKIIIPCNDKNTDLQLEELPWNLGEYDGLNFDSEDSLKRQLYLEIKKIRREISKQLIKNVKSKKEKRESISILLKTDEKTYQDGNIIHVTGKVEEIVGAIPIVLEFISPTGSIVE